MSKTDFYSKMIEHSTSSTFKVLNILYHWSMYNSRQNYMCHQWPLLVMKGGHGTMFSPLTFLFIFVILTNTVKPIYKGHIRRPGNDLSWAGVPYMQVQTTWIKSHQDQILLSFIGRWPLYRSGSNRQVWLYNNFTSLCQSKAKIWTAK